MVDEVGHETYRCCTQRAVEDAGYLAGTRIADPESQVGLELQPLGAP